MVTWAHLSRQPNGISIGSAICAGLTSVTDHATRSVTVGRIYVRSTAMQPNNVAGLSNGVTMTVHKCG